jgi:ferric-dicitrate binding protein FerR (iron transport regulator)
VSGSGQGNRRLRGAIQTHLRNRAAVRLQRGELFFQPQARSHQDLIVTATAGMHPAPGIAKPLGQARLDRRMAVLKAIVQHECAAAKILGQRIQLALQRGGFIRRHDADIRQTFHMRLAGGDVVQKKFAI